MGKGWEDIEGSMKLLEERKKEGAEIPLEGNGVKAKWEGKGER